MAVSEKLETYYSFPFQGKLLLDSHILMSPKILAKYNASGLWLNFHLGIIFQLLSMSCLQFSRRSSSTGFSPLVAQRNKWIKKQAFRIVIKPHIWWSASHVVLPRFEICLHYNFQLPANSYLWWQTTWETILNSWFQYLAWPWFKFCRHLGSKTTYGNSIWHFHPHPMCIYCMSLSPSI